MPIHASADDAVHAHVGADAVTVMSPLPPSDGYEAVVGATVNVQGGGGVAGAAAWLMVTAVPATVSMPARLLVAV
jgi:hypothetical protein